MFLILFSGTFECAVFPMTSLGLRFFPRLTHETGIALFMTKGLSMVLEMKSEFVNDLMIKKYILLGVKN